MSTAIARVDIRYEQDVVYVRQRARLIAALLGFDHNDQTRISTALSELARNAYSYAGAGEVEFALAGDDAAGPVASARRLEITVRDHGAGITDAAALLEGRYRSSTGMGLGIIGARRLMDDFSLDTRPGKGTTLRIGKTLPREAPPVTEAVLARVADALARSEPESPLQEIQVQNQELLRTLGQLRERQEELVRVNLELEDTNRGVVALYKELELGNDRLARANRLKTQFVSNLSHEFRTPLNSILAISGLLLERTDGELTAEQDKQLGFIRNSVQNLSAMVNDLLDTAKIESGTTVAKPQDCSAAQILGGLRGMFKPLATAPDVSLVIEDPQGIPRLYTDADIVSQILRNLISNALKFTQRGEIRVCTRLSGDARAVIFSVADSGIGIAPQDQARIFEEYFQVKNAQGGKAKGTGLGLAICGNLARLLGGAVSVESRPGTGSTFAAIIPLRYADPDAHADAGDSAQMQALIIDDEEDARYILKRYLAGTGFRVTQAASGAEGLKLARAHKPAVIFLDLLMPDMSGLEVLHELKRDPALRDIPVIINTSKILDDAAHHALAGDAVAVLSKAAPSREAAVAAVREALRLALDSTKHPDLPR